MRGYKVCRGKSYGWSTEYGVQRLVSGARFVEPIEFCVSEDGSTVTVTGGTMYSLGYKKDLRVKGGKVILVKRMKGGERLAIPLIVKDSPCEFWE